MSDKPILFKAEMVNAIRAGTKTQTRRIIKIPSASGGLVQIDSPRESIDLVGENEWAYFDANGGMSGPVKPPYGVSGEELWVRESWSGEWFYRNTKPSERFDSCIDGYVHQHNNIWYWADGEPSSGDWEKPRPSIHMPRYASRVQLSILTVRAERLNDITEKDAIAEGMKPMVRGLDGSPESCPIEDFSELWQSINGESSWHENPWVWVYEFKPLAGTN